MTHADELTPPPEQRHLIGTFRRFGEIGPVYEILAFDHRLDDGDWMMRIRVVESGEELDYTLAELISDPSEG